MSILQKIILSISLLFFFGSLLYLTYRDEKRMKKYPLRIYQYRHKYATDKVEKVPDGIKFIDHEGRNIYISGNYVIEELTN